MTNNVGFTFTTGDTTPRFTISIEQDNIEIIFSVAMSSYPLKPPQP